MVVVLFSACNKEKEDEIDLAKQIPVITTIDVSDVTQISATSGGIITSDAGSTVTVRGICWSTNETPTLSDSTTKNGAGAGTFASILTNLKPETTYYLRAYATNKNGTGYGMTMSFTTLNAILPVISTSVITEITASSAKGGGNVLNDGFSNVTAKGVCWSKNASPTLTDNYSIDSLGVGSFSSSIENLDAGEQYYVRAYATNSKGTAYGEQRSFRTFTLPLVTVNPSAEVRATSVKILANATADGGTPITTKGVCWSLNPNPTLANNYIENGPGLGNYQSIISDLQPNTVYYIKAYATNSVGTTYSNELSFTTSNGLISISTNPISIITQISARSGGTISTDGGSDILAKGVCWSSGPDPTINDFLSYNGVGIDPYISNLTGLESQSIYYVKAYATNSFGTFYGDAQSFETLGPPNIDNPLTVEQAIAYQNTTPYMISWVKGFIVGSVVAGTTTITSPNDIHWSGPFTLATNVVIADTQSETDFTKCLVVNLPAGTLLRAEVNLMDNPENLSKRLFVFGMLRTYFGIAGLRDSPGTASDFLLESGGGGSGNTIFTEEFTASMGSFSAFSVEGAQVWNWANFDGGCALISGFVNPNRFPNEDWLISPAIDLSTHTGSVLNIRQAANYVDGQWDLLQVMISSNYDGTSNPNTQGTWTELQVPNRPSGTNWTFVDSGDINIGTYDGQSSVHIAFRYRSTNTVASSWEISKVAVKANN